MNMVNVTVSVSEDLRKRMRRLKHVNWSDAARRAFEEEVEREERLAAAETIKKLREASPPDWNGAKEIRRWRDAR